MAGISGQLAYDPSQLAGLNPGANNGGGVGNTLAPVTGVMGMGGSSNPFLPTPTSGTTMPPAASPYSPSGTTAALASGNYTGGGTLQGAGLPNQQGGGNGPGMTNLDLAKSFQSSGTMPGGLGTAASQFMTTGAGYNPAVANALIAAMQPQIQQGQANIMEQFGGTGQADSSPAGYALGNYLAQTNLDVGTLLSGLYEQSVQNYMQVLGMGKVNVSQQSQQGGGILGALGALIPGIGPMISSGIGNLDTQGTSTAGEQFGNFFGGMFGGG